jgi:hypothetical protein
MFIELVVAAQSFPHQLHDLLDVPRLTAPQTLAHQAHLMENLEAFESRDVCENEI